MSVILWSFIAFIPWNENCFSCRQSGIWGKYGVRSAVKKLYQLRPKVSASRVPVASRVVNPKHDELRPAVSKEFYQLRPKLFASCIVLVSRVVNRTRVSCIEKYGYSKCPTI